MESSPRDLSVLFRSFERRRREALGGVHADHPHVREVIHELDVHLATVAHLVGVGPDQAAIADELANRPAPSWSEAELSHLRELALHLGALLRTLEHRSHEVRSGDDEHA